MKIYLTRNNMLIYLILCSIIFRFPFCVFLLKLSVVTNCIRTTLTLKIGGFRRILHVFFFFSYNMTIVRRSEAWANEHVRTNVDKEIFVYSSCNRDSCYRAISFIHIIYNLQWNCGADNGTLLNANKKGRKKKSSVDTLPYVLCWS